MTKYFLEPLQALFCSVVWEESVMSSAFYLASHWENEISYSKTNFIFQSLIHLLIYFLLMNLRHLLTT